MNEIVKKEQDVFMSIIEKVVMNPDVDVHKMNAILDLQQKVMARQAELDFHNDMASLKAELNNNPIIKSRKNGQTKSTYADLDDVKSVIDPLLSKYGFYDKYEDDFPADGIVGTTCVIVHRNGHKEKNRVQFTLDNKGIAGSVNKTTVHATASSLTYGQRISLCRALGVRISDDDDGNLAGAQTITQEQEMWINEILHETNADVQRFLQYMGVQKVGNIPAAQFEKAKIMLEDKRSRMGVR